MITPRCTPWCRFSYLAALALTALTLTLPARATNEEDAEQQFARGVELFQQGDFTGALQAFQAADRAHHSPAITYNIARSRESLGQAQAAVDAYEQYLTEPNQDTALANASVVALAKIKQRCTRLRVNTSPAGARVFVDGIEVHERSPVAVLVFSGGHRISVELGGWKDASEYQASGSGSDSVSFEKPAKKTAAATKPPAPPPAAPKPAAPKSEKPRLEGLMGGAGLSLYGYSFVGKAEETNGSSKTTADEKPTGLVFGLSVDVGWALSRKTALLLRGFGGLGSAEGELATLAAGGPAVSYRLADSWWVGGGVLFGRSQADSDATRTESNVASAKDDQLTYETSLAVGPMLELSYVLGENAAGHWLVSLMPSTLVTTFGEQSTVFVPVIIGHRWL